MCKAKRGARTPVPISAFDCFCDQCGIASNAPLHPSGVVTLRHCYQCKGPVRASTQAERRAALTAFEHM